MKQEVTTVVGGKEIKIETGRMAKQANGSVVISQGSNIVLVTAVGTQRDSKKDFLPLTVEYQEKFYASGKIPGGYFKREGRPTNEAILNCRLIDRPLRPLFSEGYHNDTQIVATVLSTDGGGFPLEILASIGASAALHISELPFNGPCAAVVVGRVDGKFIANPSRVELEKSDIEILLNGTKNGILMVEGECKFVSEEDVLAALKFGHDAIQPVIEAQNKLRELTGNKPRWEFKSTELNQERKQKIEGLLRPKVEQALGIKEKLERYKAVDVAVANVTAELIQGEADDKVLAEITDDIGKIVGDLKYEVARNMVLKTGSRIDGRDTTTVRPITCEAGILPRVHGSGLFTRGETQVMGTVTLGTEDDEQIIDTLYGKVKKKFLLHYNFPPYSVGESGRMGGQSRREIGHGFLAERSLKSIIPDFDAFPYTIRIVSEVLESNGSSSMGTVCSGILALLDAGVPVKGNVAGIAMGLIKEGDDYAILSDILGDEDHLGDMDFKVAGTREGITALQMDIKIDSIDFAIMEKAMNQAKAGRDHILDEMEKVISKSRKDISQFAPRIETIKIKSDKVREVIGAGGKVIRGIIEETGVKIDIEDDGTIHVASVDPEATKKAIAIIQSICEEPIVGKTYSGKVIKITDFGAFVEVLPNTQGLLHISEVSVERIRAVTDVLSEGETIDVKILDIDRAGRIKLSRKALLGDGDSKH